MSKKRWQPRYVLFLLWLGNVLIAAALVEVAIFNSFYAFVLAFIGALTVYFLKDSDGSQLLDPKHLKKKFLFYYYPMDRICQVSDRLFFADVGEHQQKVDGDGVSPTPGKLSWQGRYVECTWVCALLGTALAFLETAVWGTHYIMAIPSICFVQLAFFKNKDGKMLFHPTNMPKEKKGGWSPMKSFSLVSDHLFWK